MTCYQLKGPERWAEALADFQVSFDRDFFECVQG